MVYSGMTAMKPATMRVETRYGTDGMPMTSRASISSEMRMAPSCAVKPQPTVADSASEVTMGAISRVLTYAERKPVSTEAPICSRAALPCRPTTTPVKPVIMKMTPTVPPSTASTPTPKVTSAMMRSTSWRKWRTA